MTISANLSGKKALVTGASSDGLGRFFAETLGKAGAEIVISARRAEPLSALAKQLADAGVTATAAPMDVSDLAAVKEVMGKHGPFDIVVNNAGVSTPKPILSQTEEDYDFVLDINLKGVWNVAIEAARSMSASTIQGSIINIASITGLRQVKTLTPYAVSKAGVIQLTKQLGLELAEHGIRVNAIAPGYFASDMTREWFETEAGQALIRRIPMRRLGDFENLQGPLLLLASDASAFMTGSVISVDGGHLLSSL